MENTSRFPSGPFCSLSGQCGKGGGWWAAGHAPGKAKIHECLHGMDVISKSLRGSSLSPFPAQNLRFSNASSIPFRTFPTKCSCLSKLVFSGKKKKLFLKKNLRKFCIVSADNNLYKLKALRTSYCVMFLASLANCLPSSASNRSGAILATAAEADNS